MGKICGFIVRTLNIMKNVNKLFFYLSILILITLGIINFKYKNFMPGIALLSGIIIATFLPDHSLTHKTKVWATKTLSSAIILLGFGFNLTSIFKAGVAGFGYTVISISLTLIIGLLLGVIFKNNNKISTLVSSGTAICGGSAIAAISPVIRAESNDTAVAMGAIFLLNAVGLLVFPVIGHMLGLTQHQFGLLAALAIHDTSSVVGSCLSYGQESLMVGTTIKLVRALWIIPITLIIATIYSKFNKNSNSTQKIKKPWFILWFIVASLVVTIFPSMHVIGTELKHIGESLFTLALFLIGYNVSFKNIRAVGVGVLLQAVILWVLVSIAVIFCLKAGILK